MPKGLKRYYGDDHLHFLTSSCYHRQPWLGGARGRDLFLHILEEARRLLRKQRRKSAQAELWPEQQQRVGQRRFYDFNVWSQRKRVEKLRYMHRNPVKRGLVLEPEPWEWSSYRGYAYDEVGVVKINQWPAGGCPILCVLCKGWAFPEAIVVFLYGEKSVM